MGLVTWCRLLQIRDLVLDILFGFVGVVGFVGFVGFVEFGWSWTFPCCCFVGSYCRVVVNLTCYFDTSIVRRRFHSPTQ